MFAAWRMRMQVIQKRLIANILKSVIYLIGCAGIGFVLLVFAYMLPTEPMKAHILESIEVFYTESVYPQVVAGFKSSQLDNETDAIMLLDAIYENGEENAVQKAAKVPRIYIDGEHSGCRTLVRNIWEGEKTGGIMDYGRYWHGYLIFLKPLLLVFNYAEIRYLNMFLQFFLLGWVVVLFTERGMKKYLLPFFTALMILNPVVIPLSLQFSSIYYILLAALIFLLKRKEWLAEKKERYGFLFLFVGIATAYFDFLTYPPAALVIPLAIALLMEQEKLKEAVIKAVGFSFCWGVGYAGMWFLKWVFCLLVTKQNIFAEVYGRLTTHIGGNAGDAADKVTVLQSLWKNLSVFARSPYLVLIIAVLACMVIGILKHRNTGSVYEIIPFLLIALIPILWLMLTKGHAKGVYWYASRGLSGSVFAGLCGLVYVFRDTKKED